MASYRQPTPEMLGATPPGRGAYGIKPNAIGAFDIIAAGMGGGYDQRAQAALGSYMQGLQRMSARAPAVSLTVDVPRQELSGEAKIRDLLEEMRTPLARRSGKSILSDEVQKLLGITSAAHVF